MDNKSILEILVDKQNEKWAGVFEHILIVLHNTIEEGEKKMFQKKYKRPHFSFEIAKIWNKIRFFIVSEKEYINFLKNQIYAHYPNIEMYEVSDYLEAIPNDKIYLGEVWLQKASIFPIKNFSQLQEMASGWEIDPYSSLTSSLLKTWGNTLNVFMVNFSPLPESVWKEASSRMLEVANSRLPPQIKRIFLFLSHLKILFLPISWMIQVGKFFLQKPSETPEEGSQKPESPIDEPIQSKLALLGYGVDINILCASQDNTLNKLNIKEIFSPLTVYSLYNYNAFWLSEITQNPQKIENVKQRICQDRFVLSTKELSWLVHLPTTYVKTPNINWVLSRNFEPPVNIPLISQGTQSDLTPIGKTNFRWEELSFGISPSDRRRHMYIIWKTGMWKSTLLENMILDDIKKWRGVAVIDPHGDLAESIIGNIPKSRTNQTIIFDPSDRTFPIAFNMFDGVDPAHRPLIASWLVGIFKKIFWDSWGPRLEHTLRNTILALLEYPNTTLISIPLMLTSDVYRNKVVSKIKDPVVKWFWVNEYAKMAPNQKVETAWPILNKVGQFLSSSILRNILWQPKNSFNIRWAMDNKKIIIINLSKGKIGEDASALLGAMMVTKFQMDAMSRADIPEDQRQDFYLYVDEFQNFATDSFATILSEARKYKLNLVMANQYIDQMTEMVKGAVFWNVWSLISFQVWYHDSMIMKEVFWNDISNDDLTNLKKYSIYLKQLIDGMPSKVFSADTFPPYPIEKEIFETRYKKILQVSREKYSTPSEKVEQKIYESIQDIATQEEAWQEKKTQTKKK